MYLFSHGSQISTDTMRGAFIKKHETPEASAVGGGPRRLALASHPPPLARLIGVNEGGAAMPPAHRGRQCSCSLSCGLR